MASPRVLIIGWDGASFDLLKPWVDEGRLPNLESLLSRGASGGLTSILPILSPAAWTTILTGVLPEVHGIFGFVRAEPGSHEPATASSAHRRCPALWQTLGESSLDSVFLWVPATYPPEPMRGVMVTGMGTPGVYSDFSYPPQIKRELLDTFGVEVVEPGLVGRGREEYVRELLVNVGVQGKAAEHILRTHAPTLAMVAFTQCDSVQHFFWSDMESCGDRGSTTGLSNAILNTYQELDRVLGKLMALMGPDDLTLLISDHGARPIRKEICIDLLLEHLGLLHFLDGQPVPGRQRSVPKQTLTKILARTSLAIQDNFPRRLVVELQRISEAGPLSRLRLAANRSWSGDLDYSRTLLFPLDGSGSLYSVQTPASMTGPEWDSLEDLLVTKLASFHDSQTGAAVVKSVRRIESHDEALRTPAFAIEWADGYFGALWRGGDREIIRDPSDWRGARGGHELSCYHSLQGMVVAAGPGIQPGAGIDGARLIDIAPSALKFLGLDIPAHIQGKPLWECRDTVQDGDKVPAPA